MCGSGSTHLENMKDMLFYSSFDRVGKVTYVRE